MHECMCVYASLRAYASLRVSALLRGDRDESHVISQSGTDQISCMKHQFHFGFFLLGARSYVALSVGRPVDNNH